MKISQLTPLHFNDVKKSLDDLSAHYDGHTNSKFFNQLTHQSPVEYLTKKKIIYIATNEDNRFMGFICLNYKRGNSVKIGPIIVVKEFRGQGVGTFLVNSVLSILKIAGVRKVYTTTSEQNKLSSKLIEKFNFTIEATLPDQYKVGSQELIWGLFLRKQETASTPKISSLITDIAEDEGNFILDTKLAPEEEGYLDNVAHILSGWHEEVDKSFKSQVLSAIKRPFDFEVNGKMLLLARNKNREIKGSILIAPKRGGSAKIYPIFGTRDAVGFLLENIKNTLKPFNVRKVYTFVSVDDNLANALLDSHDFIKRGQLLSAYKPGRDLFVFDSVL